MCDRTEQMLQWLGCFLIALICFQVLRAGCRANPFARLHLPPVPTLQANAVTNANATKTNQPVAVGVPVTNVPPMAGTVTNHSSGPGTNSAVAVASTNTPTTTNSQASSTNAIVGTTNVIAASSTNIMTNAVAIIGELAKTNVTAGTTNSPVQTNMAVAGSTNMTGTTNNLAGASTNASATNIARVAGAPHLPPGGPMGGMPFMGGGFPGMPGMGGPPAVLPKEIQARVDKIVDSEIFAPVMRPLPMQLFGIAGNTALLRTDSGQSGLVKEGDSLGNVKLLRIGINRVLVEQDGQKKELMIFEGYGGESLMPKTN